LATGCFGEIFFSAMLFTSLYLVAPSKGRFGLTGPSCPQRRSLSVTVITEPRVTSITHGV
jgi:hypothetical protein